MVCAMDLTVTVKQVHSYANSCIANEKQCIGGEKMETIAKLKDMKGDGARFTARADTAPAIASVITFLTGKTYCGCKEYSTVTPGVPAEAKPVLQTDVIENDSDFKAIINYKDMSTPANPVQRKCVIPAPILDEENGICTVLEGDTRAIPSIPPSGGVGKGGNTIVSELETMFGASAGDFEFLSGGFIKNRR
jgi:hypothetical protein